MIYFAIISRTADGLALAANSDSPQMSQNEGLENAYRKMKLLSRISSKFPHRCTLPCEPFVIHFLAAEDLTVFVLCDVTYPQVLALSFLTDLQREFIQFYGKKIMSVQRPYALIEFDLTIQKLKHKYNNPRSLTTQVNLQDLSVELRSVPPYVLCEEELRPGYGQRSDKDQYRTTTASSYSQYLPLHLLGAISLTLSCFCAVLNFSRGLHVVTEIHSHIDTSFDADYYQTGATFFICSFLSLYQAFLIYFPLKRRKSLACATLGSLCVCQLYLWEHRSVAGLLFHVTVACYGTFVILTRQVQNKLPQYTL